MSTPLDRFAARVDDLTTRRLALAEPEAAAMAELRSRNELGMPAGEPRRQLQSIADYREALGRLEVEARAAHLVLAVDPLVSQVVSLVDQIVAFRAAIVPIGHPLEHRILAEPGPMLLGQLDEIMSGFREQWPRDIRPKAEREAAR